MHTSRIPMRQFRGALNTQRFAVILAAVLSLVVTLLPGTARAQESSQVTGVTIAQYDGYTTLKWVPVAEATDYQIERTAVNDANEPTGAETVVGIWVT